MKNNSAITDETSSRLKTKFRGGLNVLCTEKTPKTNSAGFCFFYNHFTIALKN